MQQAKDRGTDPPLPPVEHAARLLSLLLDLGLAGSGGMGVAPVSWTELAQWQRLTCTPLAPWEARALRQASFEYVAQLGKSTDPACPAPWADAPTDDDRARVAGGLRELFSARARRG
jgi:hypothetical protein